ncbi:MAG: hypothetical protein EBR02_02905 [Alphaproteobacteria bacterium]|nr:hypothetical protein [Alphaproteobacteria bacterium]
MKGINTLIKLSKRELDGLRREMASLETQKAQLQEATQKLSEELLREQELASKQPEMGAFFGGFATRIKKRQEEIAAEIKKLDEKIRALNEKILVAFSELKKYEIAKENAEKRALEEQNRKETIMLDEIAGQQFHRKQAENQ